MHQYKSFRKDLHDYGEFGRFELLLYAAYTWFAIAALLELIMGFALLINYPSPVAPDALRNTYLIA